MGTASGKACDVPEWAPKLMLALGVVLLLIGVGIAIGGVASGDPVVCAMSAVACAVSTSVLAFVALIRQEQDRLKVLTAEIEALREEVAQFRAKMADGAVPPCLREPPQPGPQP